MGMLIAASATFLAIHLVVSGTRLRGVIVAAIGEMPYLGLFSLASLAAIVWLCFAYSHAFASADDRVLYDLGPGVRRFAIPAVALAFLLGIPGLLMANPSSARMEGARVRGVLRITRHPFLWGTAIWAGFHLLATTMLASTIFFGTFLAVALIGTRAIDAKCRRRIGKEWQALAYQTSNLPFAAIVTGRNRLDLREYLDWRLAVAAAAFVAFLLAHQHLFGVSPFPGTWRPF